MSIEKQKTILLVEDDRITALSEQILLKKYGYEVIIENSGEGAIKTVKGSNIPLL